MLENSVSLNSFLRSVCDNKVPKRWNVRYSGTKGVVSFYFNRQYFEYSFTIVDDFEFVDFKLLSEEERDVVSDDVLNKILSGKK
ncbi:hypothetical protein H9L19_04760 [Weissella diestrammenae]|uniref:Uncharacterized protein n=1 Tax=Weissella diestrammenae TaxID=1162633 RepID=A0A7G9T3R0_9LACO|nr:hypothetical protein [Weissella diestrammenae]MCM0582717.1 hypothetical protein [Weissella diestrammenae]QNN74735.1 hypothetical protein H9L19_04760 [Weissella diestrammenae]